MLASLYLNGFSFIDARNRCFDLASQILVTFPEDGARTECARPADFSRKEVAFLRRSFTFEPDNDYL